MAAAAGQVRGGSPAFVGAVRGWSPGLGGAVGPGPAVSPGGTWLPQGVEPGYGVSFGVPREGCVPWALQRGGGRPTRGSGAGSAVPGAAVRGALAVSPPPLHRGARGSSDGGTAQKFPVALGERVWVSGAASATSSPGGDRRAGAPVPAGGGGRALHGGGVGGRGVFALMDAQGPRLGLSLAGTGQPSRVLRLTRARFWAAHGVSGRAGAAPAPSRGGTVRTGGARGSGGWKRLRGGTSGGTLGTWSCPPSWCYFIVRGSVSACPGGLQEALGEGGGKRER